MENGPADRGREHGVERPNAKISLQRAQMELELAEDLRAAGYTVTGGH
jgi:hypothetical protein